MNEQLTKIIDEEMDFAFHKFGDYHNAHELYGVLLEELDEWFDHVKANTDDTYYAMYELVQVASVALRYVVQNADISMVQEAQNVRHARG